MHSIEFLGVPGSGKTTIQKRLLQKSPKCCTLSTAAKLVYISDHSCWEPNLLLYTPNIVNRMIVGFVNIILASEDPDSYAVSHFRRRDNDYIRIMESEVGRISENVEQKQLLEHWFIRMASRHSLVSNSNIYKSDLSILIDEGFLQRVISVFCSTKPDVEVDEQLVYEYLRTVPLPDDVIAIDIPVTTAADRLNCREGGWPQRCDDLHNNERMAFLKKAADGVSIVVDFLQEQDQVTLHRIDGTNDVNSNCRKINAELI